MLTKAIIKALPEIGSNIFKVRVPYLEDNSRTEIVLNATYCITPGIYDGLSIGDCVFIDFEEDRLEKPVILGKLYINSTEKVNTKIITGNCIITDHVDLPKDAKIDGFGAQEFTSFAQLRPGGTK